MCQFTCFWYEFRNNINQERKSSYWFFFLDIENDFTIRIQQVQAKANQRNKADQEKAAELPVIKKEDEQEHVIDFNPRAIGISRI